MDPSPLLNRERFLLALDKQETWDVIVVGGGATGLGIAVDSAARGYRTLLLEQADFAKGTSSRSTKLVHGGVRYLAQGNIRLVREALEERGFLLQNAPHLVRQQSFIIPCYSYASMIMYWVGLKLYDGLSGRFRFGKARRLTKAAVIAALPELKQEKLVGGIEYFDGQFDDARLAVNLAQTAAQKGATLLNYCKVTALLKKNGHVSGAQAVDLENQKAYCLTAKVVINATGVFVDDILQMDSPGKAPLVRPSQGVHLVFDGTFFRNRQAVMIPKTSDGRVLFAVPWHNQVLVGTTDTPLRHSSLEPVALEEEIEFILSTLRQYLLHPPTRKDVKSIFAGLRPLAAPKDGSEATREISRSHKIIGSPSGLITVTGGKWTTYRRMAEDTIDKAIEMGGLPPVSCPTKSLRIHGAEEGTTSDYGTGSVAIRQLIKERPALGKKLAPAFHYSEADVLWSVRCEMARTVEDILARRTRLLFLDAKAAILAAPRVASLIAKENGYTRSWEEEQISAFEKLARHYLPADTGRYESRSEVVNLSA